MFGSTSRLGFAVRVGRSAGRRCRAGTAAVVAMVLVLGFADAVTPSAAAAAPATLTAAAKPACPADRPDQTSALVAARVCGGRVAVSGLTTARTQVWAEANGTL